MFNILNFFKKVTNRKEGFSWIKCGWAVLYNRFT